MTKNLYIDVKLNSSFLVVGTIKNCEKFLRKNISNLQSSIGHAKNIHFLLIESDSEDNTVDMLNKLVREINNFRYISLGCLINKLPVKSDRIAFCRNKYVKEINENDKYKNINYIIVADFDDVNNYLNKIAFESCWERNDWDMCSANQLGPYYDMFALRHNEWMPYDYKIQYKILKKEKPRYKKHLHDLLHSKIRTIPTINEWIEVESSFGGLAIYKKKCFYENKYEGLYKNGEEICEHVPFNQKLKKNGLKLFINPRLINAKYTEHTKPASFWKLLRRKIKRILYNYFKDE
jgi:hypothetical protein